MTLPAEPVRQQIPALEAGERDALLASRVSAMLAFIGADGYPRLAPCWFYWDGCAFYVASLPDKYHVRCLRADPRVTIGIEVAEIEHAADARQVSNRQVKGTGDAQILEDGEGRWMKRIREKYLGPGAGEPAQAESRVVIRIEPKTLSAHGGTLRLPNVPPAR